MLMTTIEVQKKLRFPALSKAITDNLKNLKNQKYVLFGKL